MRTNYHKIFLVLLVAGILAACNKQLNLAPEGTLTEKAALSDSSNSEALIAGAYLRYVDGIQWRCLYTGVI